MIKGHVAMDLYIEQKTSSPLIRKELYAYRYGLCSHNFSKIMINKLIKRSKRSELDFKRLSVSNEKSFTRNI